MSRLASQNDATGDVIPAEPHHPCIRHKRGQTRAQESANRLTRRKGADSGTRSMNVRDHFLHRGGFHRCSGRFPGLGSGYDFNRATGCIRIGVQNKVGAGAF